MVAALLSWYDERPDWLEAMAASLTKIGVDVLVAVDGAYELFPDGGPRSAPDNYIALSRGAREAGIELHRHTPAEVWPTEMDKRTFLFQQAEALTTDQDWYFVIDADTSVTWAKGVKDELERTDLDVAAVRLFEPSRDGSQKQFRLPMFFRAVRGLHVERNHYTYVTGDGRRLWGRGKTEPQLDLTERMVCEHLTYLRDPERWSRAHTYYKRRDALKVEFGTCELCPNPGHVEVPTDWRPHAKGLSSVWITVCEACEPKVRAENDRVIRAHGLDPRTVQVTFEKVA